MQPIVNVPQEDRATDIGNMHKKIGKDRGCGSGDILPDTQIDRHTHTCTHTDMLRSRSSRYGPEYIIIL